jgi:hypothetical protein
LLLVAVAALVAGVGVAVLVVYYIHLVQVLLQALHTQ